MGRAFQSCKEQRSGVWLHNTGNRLNSTKLYLKRNEMANFMSFMFYHNLKKNLKTKQNEKTKTNQLSTKQSWRGSYRKLPSGANCAGHFQASFHLILTTTLGGSCN